MIAPVGPQLIRLEVWSWLACDEGEVLASFPRWRDSIRALDLTGSSTYSFAYPTTSIADAHVRKGRVIRRVTADPEFIEEWIVRTVTRDSRSGWVQVECDHPRIVLTDYVVQEVLENGFPNTDIGRADFDAQSHVEEHLLPSLPTWIGIGLIRREEPITTPAGDVLTTPEGEPITALLAQRLDYHATGVTGTEWCDGFAAALAPHGGGEWQFRRVGDDGYVLDFVREVGSDAPVVYAESGKNVEFVERTEDWTSAATVVRPEDAEGRGLWHMAFVVAEKVGGNVLRLRDALNRDISPVPITGCWDGHLLVKDAESVDSEKIVSSTEPDLVQVEDDTDYEVGHLVGIRVDDGEDGVRVSELVNAVAIAEGYPRRLKRIRTDTIIATRNLIANPFQREWSNASGAPDGYTLQNGSITRVEGEYGGYAAQLTTTRYDSPAFPRWETGQDGLLCIRIRATLPAGLDPELDPAAAFVVSLRSATNSGKTWTFFAPGTQDIVIQNVDPSVVGGSDPLFLSVGARQGLTPISGVVIDAMQVTPGGADPGVYLEGSDANVLLQQAGAHLIAHAPTTAVRWTGTLRDLARAGGAHWEEDVIRVGGSVALVAPGLASGELLRVLRYSAKDDSLLDSEVELGTRQQLLSEQLEAGSRPSRASLLLALLGTITIPTDGTELTPEQQAANDAVFRRSLRAFSIASP